MLIFTINSFIILQNIAYTILYFFLYQIQYDIRADCSWFKNVTIKFKIQEFFNQIFESVHHSNKFLQFSFVKLHTLAALISCFNSTQICFCALISSNRVFLINSIFRLFLNFIKSGYLDSCNIIHFFVPQFTNCSYTSILVPNRVKK